MLRPPDWRIVAKRNVVKRTIRNAGFRLEHAPDRL
jgi:hypothetical protein